MTELSRLQPPDWPALLRDIRHEVAALSTAERAWLDARLAAIAVLQEELDALFAKAGGSSSCAGCDGACCGCGRHHFTLTNLLAYLLAGEEPPVPDFGRSCPFLGATGCRLPAARRPYNCITFFCETLEDRLNPGDQACLRHLDHRLRTVYQQIAARYPGASLRGLWIALERCGEGRLLLLSSSEQDVLR